MTDGNIYDADFEENNYSGVLIPDHPPQMSCAAPWHAGMAYALGFMRGALKIHRGRNGWVKK